MTALASVLSAFPGQRLGWTLLHSFWQGAAVGLAVWVLLVVLRRRSANLRYLVACGGLLVMFTASVLTFTMLPGTAKPGPSVAAAASAPALAMDSLSPRPSIDAGPLVDQTPAMSPEALFENGGPPPVSSVTTQPVPWRAAWKERLDPWLPWLSAAWLFGVVALSTRNLGGWFGTRRLRRGGVAPSGGGLAQCVGTLAARMTVSRPVQVLQSALVEVPLVLGWLRPVILLPVGVLSGLSPAQLEAILAHELAHVRRHDYLVNLLQTVLETLFFYHPAVWWISRQIRAEREHCCDDLAVGVCGSGIGLGEALALLAAARLRIRPALAAPGDRPSGALRRVRRLLEPKAESAEFPKSWAAVAVLLFLGLALTVGWTHFAAAKTEDQPAPAADDSSVKEEYTFPQVLEGLSQRDTKYTAARFRIDYRRTVNDMEGNKEPRTEYDTLLAQWRSFREQARRQPDSDVLTTRLKQYELRAAIDPYRVDVESEDDRPEEGPRHLRFHAYNVNHSIETTLGPQILGLDAQQVNWWRGVEKAGNLRIEKRMIGQIDCVVLSAVGGGELALAPQYDWAPVKCRDAVASDFRQYDGFWIPSKIEHAFVMSIWVEPHFISYRDVLEIRDVKTGDAAGFTWERGGSNPFALPTPRPGDRVDVAYPRWNPAWDDELVEASSVCDAVKSEHRFDWREPLPPEDAILWTISKCWSNGFGVRLALSPDSAPEQVGSPYNAPLPFLAPDGRGIQWAVYDFEQKRLRQIPVSRLDALPESLGGFLPEVDRVEKDGISFEAGFSVETTPVVLGNPIEVTFYVKNTGLEPIYLVTGGDGRSVRSYRFRFAGFDAEGFSVPDPYEHVDHHGGMSGPPPEIKPGETYRETLRLDRWLQFERPGEYCVYAGRTLQFGRDHTLGSLQAPYRLVHPLHTALRLQVEPSGQANEPQTPAWGQPVEGVQCRVRSAKSTWTVGQTPEILADLRNGGKSNVSIGLAPENWEVQYDGDWYRPTVMFLGLVRRLDLKPGAERDGISLQLGDPYEWKSKVGDRPLEFKPGKHTLRAAFHLIIDDARGLQAESNAVEFEIVPAESPPAGSAAEPPRESPKETAKGAPKADSLQVSGRVVDDQTGQPVSGFVIQGGQVDKNDPSRIQWGFTEQQTTSANPEGRFSTQIQWGTGGRARILADGYLPQPILDEAPAADVTRIEDRVVRLRRGAALRGRVLDDEGKPVAGAKVFFRGPGSLSVTDGQTEQGSAGAAVAETDRDGRFTITGGGEETSQILVLAPRLNVWCVPAPKEGSNEAMTIRLPRPAAIRVVVDIPGAVQGNEQRMTGAPGRIEPAGKEVHLRLQLKTWEMEGWKLAGDFIATRGTANPGEVVFENLAPGPYDLLRSKTFFLGDRGQGAFCDRQDVTLLPGETKTIRLVRGRGQRVGGQLRGLPEEAPGAFLKVRPIEVTGDPRNTDEWKLPVFDALACARGEKFLTSLLEPGRYRIVAEAFLPEPKTGVWRSGERLPAFVGTAEVTIEDDDPADPKKPSPQITIEMKPYEGAAAKNAAKAKLDFLAELPEFHELDLKVTEKDLQRIIAEKGLRDRVAEDGSQKTHHVYRRDGENVIVMFKEGKCSGVQRMRKDASSAKKLFEGSGEAEAIDPAEVRRKIAALAVPDETVPHAEQPMNWLAQRRARIVPQLLAGLDDPNPQVAESCLGLLEGAPACPELTDALIVKAGDPKSPLRRAALRRLEKSAGDPRVAPLLDRASTESESFPDPVARARWAWLAGHKDRAIEILKPLLEKSDETRYETVEAIRLLGEMGDAAGVELLKPIAAGDHWGLAVEAYKALARIGPKEHGLTADQVAILEKTRNFKETTEQFQQRMAELAKLKREEIRPLVMQMLRDKSLSGPPAALVILAVWKDREALPQIRQRMQDRRSYCRQPAVATFLAIDESPQSQREVLDLLSPDNESANEGVLRGIAIAAIPADHKVSMLRAAGYNPRTPYAVPNAVRYTLRQDQDVAELLVPLMDAEANLQPLAGYCEIAAQDKERRFGGQVRRAVKLLAEEPTVAAGGGQTSTSIAEAGALILAAAAAYDLKDLGGEVEKLMRSENPILRNAARAAGAKLAAGQALAEATQTLYAQLASEDRNLRRQAAQTLLNLKPADETDRAERERCALACLGKSSEDYALQVLATCGGADSVKALAPILDDPDPQRGLYAAWVLAQLPERAAAAKALRRVAIFGMFRHQMYQQGAGIDFEIAPDLYFHQVTSRLNPASPASPSREGPVRIPDELLGPFALDEAEQAFAVQCYRLADLVNDMSGLAMHFFDVFHPQGQGSLAQSYLPLLREIAEGDSRIEQRRVDGRAVAHFKYRRFAAKAIAALVGEKATYPGLAGEKLASDAFPAPYPDQDRLLAGFFLDRLEKAQLPARPETDRQWRQTEIHRARALQFREQFGSQVLEAIRQEAKRRNVDVKNILPPEPEVAPAAKPAKKSPATEGAGLQAPADARGVAKVASPSRQLLDEFRETYALPNDKTVKRVAPPFSPGRMEYYRVHDAHQAEILPEGPEYYCFHWGVKKPGPAEPSREGMLHLGVMGWTGGKGQEIAGLVSSFTGINHDEMLGDQKLIRTKVTGDWVIRDGAPPEKLLQGLAAILQTECKVPVRFRLAQEDRRVIVAEGEYVFHPLPGNADYFDEAHVAWDRIDVYEKDRARLMEEGGSGLDDLFDITGMFLNRPVVNEVSRPPENPVCWRWSARRYREAREKGDVDEVAVLKHLAEQTGMKFSEQTRRVRVLHVERVEASPDAPRPAP